VPEDAVDGEGRDWWGNSSLNRGTRMEGSDVGRRCRGSAATPGLEGGCALLRGNVSPNDVVREYGDSKSRPGALAGVQQSGKKHEVRINRKK
jgi:hypothetical protein